jgi:hypothetical protein
LRHSSATFSARSHPSIAFRARSPLADCSNVCKWSMYVTPINQFQAYITFGLWAKKL